MGNDSTPARSAEQAYGLIGVNTGQGRHASRFPFGNPAAARIPHWPQGQSRRAGDHDQPPVIAVAVWGHAPRHDRR